MMKTVTICQCDLCGKIAEAKPAGSQYNETIYGPPEGWTTSEYNREVHFCPACAAYPFGNIASGKEDMRNGT